VGLNDEMVGNARPILLALLATTTLVLLIACANVANLFLVRAEARQQELAVRAALGANRSRIARELLVESMLLGLAGGAAGLLFARVAIDLLKRLAPATLPRVEEIGVNPVVVLFTTVISLAAGLVFGLIPVLKLGTLNAIALREGGRGASAGPGRQRTRNTLVVAQVAMALVLLITSGLMIRTFAAMQHVKPGFTHPEQVQTFRIEVPEALTSDPVRMARTHGQIAERLRQVPGVVSVSLSSHITMDGEDNGNPLRVDHINIPEGQMPPLRRFKSIAPGYFETMGNPLVAGRDLTWTEVFEGRPVVILSENLAREYWGSPSNALGKRVRGFQPAWYQVVGIAGDERDDGLDKPATAVVYWPLLSQAYRKRNVAYAVRSTRVGTPGFLGELERAVWSVNRSLPLAKVLTLEEIQADSMAQTSFAMVMLAIAAAVALLLGMVGIYGVIAYIATQRTREIGIRIALGAQTRDVRRLFLRHGLLLTGVGIAAGICVSLALTRVMSTMLFGVSPIDPPTYTAVSLGLAAVALVATWLPARRASRVDPVTTLRAGG
jgi:predicted permease